MKDLRGACYLCPYYNDFINYCRYYHIVLNGQIFEPTCFNKERIIEKELLKSL